MIRNNKQKIMSSSKLRKDISTFFEGINDLLSDGKVPDPLGIAKEQFRIRFHFVRAYDSLTPAEKIELRDKLDQIDKCYDNASQLYVAMLGRAYSDRGERK